jgi:hypothetical protein
VSNPQPQPQGSTAPLTLAAVEAYLIGLYVGAEAFLTGQVTRFLKRMQPTPVGAAIVRQQIRQAAYNIVGQLEQRTQPLVGQMVATAVRDGWNSGGAGAGGGSHGGFLPPDSNPGFDPYELHGVRAARAIRDDLNSELQDVRFRLTRLDDDLYKIINPAGAAGQVIPNGYTPQQAQAKAWREFVARGITGFTDKSGRDWSLSSYVEMAVRTASSRAYNASRLQLLQYQGINLCICDDTGHPCPLCFPWQGVVLAITPDGVHPTVAEATAAGLFHPNAILGNQPVRVLGEAENGVRAWYDGPSVNVTCASGVQIAVSPNHPVLTSTGWLPAKFLREGMQVFSTADGHGRDAASADEDLDNVPVLIEQVLDAVAATGGRASVPASSDDLHGDAVWVHGEIDVVLADRDLVSVVQSYGVEKRLEGALPRADVQPESSAAFRAEQLRLLRVERSVAGALPHFDASALYSAEDRRAADAETVGDILGGLAADVAPDQIVSVELYWFVGHAFDLQTSSGAYVASSILVHNCRHHLSAFMDGFSTVREPKPWTDAHAAAYKATQKQRSLERDIRSAKRQALYALTPQSAKDARLDIRQGQAALRQFLADNPDLNLLRQSRREQIAFSNATVNVLPYGG